MILKIKICKVIQILFYEFMSLDYGSSFNQKQFATILGNKNYYESNNNQNIEIYKNKFDEDSDVDEKEDDQIQNLEAMLHSDEFRSQDFKSDIYQYNVDHKIALVNLMVF